MSTGSKVAAVLAASSAALGHAVGTPSCAVTGKAYEDAAVLAPLGAYLTDAAACQTSCQSSLTCTKFTFDPKSTPPGACWLYGDAASEKTQADAISGPKACATTLTDASTNEASTHPGVAADSSPIAVDTGLTNQQVDGRVVIVHDVTGGRVACSPLVAAGDKLEANDFVKYPGYTGPLSVTGSVDFESEDKPGQAMTYKLSGTDPECGTKDITGVANACGIHIHTGTSCVDAATVGGHYWDHAAIASDPWQVVTYSTGTEKTAGQVLEAAPGGSAEGGGFPVMYAVGGAVGAAALGALAFAALGSAGPKTKKEKRQRGLRGFDEPKTAAQLYQQMAFGEFDAEAAAPAAPAAMPVLGSLAMSQMQPMPQMTYTSVPQYAYGVEPQQQQQFYYVQQ